MSKFSNYETECVANYIECHSSYFNTINKLIDELNQYWDLEDIVTILSGSLRDICEYDFTESAKEASSLARLMLFNSLGCVNFNEIALSFITNHKAI